MPLDVLLDLRLASYRGGGIARYARELHAALSSLPDIQVTALRSRRDPHRDEHDLGIRTPPHHRLESWSTPVELALQRRHPTVFHATDFIAPYLPGTRQVATVHDLAFLDWPEDLSPAALRYYTQLARSRHHTDAWITPSRWTADALADRYAIPVEDIHVIPHGASLDLLSAPVVPRHERGTYVLAVGTVEPRKQYDLLLAALDLDPTLPSVVIAGSPGWNSATTEARLRSNPRVSWEPPVGDERLRDLYRNALALVVPSRAEGFGLPALEAMASGTPVISSGGGALPEVTGDAALTVQHATATAWATALQQLVFDSTYWQRLAEAGRVRAATFSWSKAAAATADVYRAVARR